MLIKNIVQFPVFGWTTSPLCNVSFRLAESLLMVRIVVDQGRKARSNLRGNKL